MRRVQRAAEPPSREPFAPARNTSSGAPRANPFASLENETTQAVQVSDELLGLAREQASDGGATKAYQVPPELLELARANKEKRAAARRAEQAVATLPEEKPALQAATAPLAPAPEQAITPSTPPARESKRPPSVIVAPSDLARPSAAPFELAPLRAIASAAAEPEEVPDFRGSGARRRVARLVLAALCLIALCAVGALCGRLIRDHHLTMAPAPAADPSQL